MKSKLQHQRLLPVAGQPAGARGIHSGYRGGPAQHPDEEQGGSAPCDLPAQADINPDYIGLPGRDSE